MRWLAESLVRTAPPEEEQRPLRRADTNPRLSSRAARVRKGQDRGTNRADADALEEGSSGAAPDPRKLEALDLIVRSM